MEVTKLTFVRELMDIKNPYYEEIEFGGIGTLSKIATEGEDFIKTETFNKIRYEVKQFCTVINGRKKKINYLLKCSDVPFFDELAQITENELKEESDKRAYEMEHILKSERLQALSSIKRLPWYKRLFNNF